MTASTKKPKRRQRAPGAGRPKSTPMRQHLANFQPCRRTPKPPSTAVAAPLTADAPADLGEYGRFLWQMLVVQDADCAEKSIVPSVGAGRFALAHAYASAFDRWAQALATIRSLEAEQPEGEEHMAMWIADPETGDLELRGVWHAEIKFRKEAIAAARALGIGSQHPTTAINVNLNGQQVAADPALRYIGPAREAAQIIEATAEAAA